MIKMKNKEMCIALFAGYYVPHLGGVEKYTYYLAKYLRKLNVKTIVITTNYDDTSEFTICNEEGSEVIRIPIYNLFKGRYPIPKKDNKINDELDKHDIKAIIVNTRFHLTSLVGAKYGHKKNIPVFQVEHGSQHLTVDNKILDFFGAIYEHCLTKYLKHFVDQYYGVSKEACNWQKHFKIDSNGVWYNSIEDYSSDIVIKKSDSKKINVLYAGRVIKQKGIVELVDAFKRIETEYDNVTLTIAGDGNLLETLKENNKSKNIKIIGKVDFDKLKKLYATTDVLVYAPIWPEGLPTTILEAGIAKCAVIASPQGGIKEIIDNSTGILINNTDELYTALKELINDPQKRQKLGDELNKKVINEFEWKKTSAKVYSDIKKYIDE